jgi:hypothetical protein
MKVIRVDNFDRENWKGNERCMTRSGLSQGDAEIVCQALRENPDRRDEDWYEVVEDDHVLWRFES